MLFLKNIESSQCIEFRKDSSKHEREMNNSPEKSELDAKQLLLPFGKWKATGLDNIDLTKEYAVLYSQKFYNWKKDERTVSKELEETKRFPIKYNDFRINCTNFLCHTDEYVGISQFSPVIKIYSDNLDKHTFEFRFIAFPKIALIISHFLNQAYVFEDIEAILKPFEWDQQKNTYSNPELYQKFMGKIKKQIVIDALAYCKHFFSLNIERPYDEKKDKSIFSVLSLLARQAKEENLMNEFLSLIYHLSLCDFFKNVTKELFNTIPDEEASWTPYIKECFEKSDNIKLLFGKRPEVLAELAVAFAQSYYAKKQLPQNITLIENFLEILSIDNFFRFIKKAAENCLPDDTSNYSADDYFKKLLMKGLNIKMCLEKMLPEFNKYITQITFLFYEAIIRFDSDIVDKLQQISNENKINKTEVKKKRTFPDNVSYFYGNNNTAVEFTPEYKNNGSQLIAKSSESVHTQKIEFTQTIPFNEVEFLKYIIQKYNNSNAQEREGLSFVQYKKQFIEFLCDKNLIKNDSIIIKKINNMFRSNDSMSEDRSEQNSSQMLELMKRVDDLTEQNKFLMQKYQETTAQITQLLQIVSNQAQKQKELENQISSMCNSNNDMRIG